MSEVQMLFGNVKKMADTFLRVAPLVCPTCGRKLATETVRIGDTEIELPCENCECEKYKELETERKDTAMYFLMDSNIPKEFRYDDINKWYANSQSKLQTEFAKDYIKRYDVITSSGIKFDEGFLLVGSKGIGKTRLACHIMRRLIERGVKCYFVATHKLVNELRVYKDYDSGLTDYVNKLSSVPVLLIDDIGESDMATWRETYFKEVINNRMERRKITFFTSMYGFDVLCEKLGEHIVSRMMKLVYDNILVIENGVDMRIQSNIEKYEVKK